MSLAADLDRAAIAHEAANDRAKRILNELAEVNRLAYAGVTISEAARRLGMSRQKVRFMRRVLQWDCWGKGNGAKMAFRTNRAEALGHAW